MTWVTARQRTEVRSHRQGRMPPGIFPQLRRFLGCLSGFESGKWDSAEGLIQRAPMLPRDPGGHSKDMVRSDTPVKVFLADDSPLVRGRVAAMLDEGGMKVVGQAETPESSIHGILSARPDVVVLDVQLEGGSGLQVLRAVREVAPSIGFVVFSNSAGCAYRKRYLGEGADRFLDKTTEFDQLVLAVANASRHAP
jgi:CheY-like chemotaxis protein